MIHSKMEFMRMAMRYSDGKMEIAERKYIKMYELVSQYYPVEKDD